jgi:hypothetical protein
MVEAVIRALIYICVIVLLFFLIVWVLATIGVHVPPMVLTILQVILALICVLILWRLFAPWVSGVSLWGPGPRDRP